MRIGLSGYHVSLDMASTTRRTALLAASLTVLVVACVDVRAGTVVGSPTIAETSASPPPAPVTVAYLQDGSVPDELEVIAPAQLAIRLALLEAVQRGDLPPGSDVVAFDIGQSPAVALGVAREIVANPAVTVAVEAPLTHLSSTARDLLLDSGMPILSLSGLRGSPTGGVWRRMVASVEREADLVARPLTHHRRVCLMVGSTAFSAEMVPVLETSLGERRSVTVSVIEERHGAVGRILGARCRVVAWSGPAAGAASLRTALDRQGLRLPLAVFDPARTVSFLEATASTEGRTKAFCACLDISTSDEPDAITLLHGFQANFGIELGPFGVEGWDTGTLIVESAGDRPSRASLAAALDTLTSFRGLAGTYRFDEDGERWDAPVYSYRATGARWLRVGND
jgi:ABC-type branched-subunit amino acid transport system substrate-binding protein